MLTRDAAAGTLLPPRRWAAAGPRSARVRRWLGAGAAGCVVGWGADQFTPMLLLYRARLGLSARSWSAHVGMYASAWSRPAAGGSLSAWIGRRRVVWWRLALSMRPAGVLAAGAARPGLAVRRRLIMGLASRGSVQRGRRVDQGAVRAAI